MGEGSERARAAARARRRGTVGSVGGLQDLPVQGARVTLSVRLGHTAGGPGERLMARLSLPISDSTILRQLKLHAAALAPVPVRVLGIDEWSWRKGVSYSTVLVDLERRQVVDVASAATTAVRCWRQHRATP